MTEPKLCYGLTYCEGDKRCEKKCRLAPKRKATTWSLAEIKEALDSVNVEVRANFNPLPFTKTMLQIQGINELFVQLRRIARSRKPKKRGMKK